MRTTPLPDGPGVATSPFLPLVAVDLGLRTGFAVYAPASDGQVRLRRYWSAHLGSRSTLRRAAPSVLSQVGPVGSVVVEGDRDMARIWERAARHHGAPTTTVSAERWRELLLVPRDRRTGVLAKQAARRLAEQVIAWSRTDAGGPPLPTGPLRHDTADAIMVGLWGVLQAELVDPADVPFPLPRPT